MSISRTLRPSAAVLTALALAGCWGGTPTTPEAPPVVPAAQENPAAPASDEFTTLEGTVALRGMPWAKAKLQVVDAITGKPAGTEGSALRAEGAMETDAEGRFSIKVAGLGVGQVARVIATLDSGTLTALVGEEGPVSAAYAVQATSFPLKISEVTLCLDQVASGVLRMAGGLTAQSASALIKGMLKDLAAMAPQLETAFAEDAQLAITLSLTANAQTGLVEDGVNVTSVLAKAGLSSAVDAAVKTATTSVAALAKDKVNVANTAALENVTLIGTSLKVTVDGGVFQVTDPATGESFTVDLTAAPVTSEPTAPTAPTVPVTSGGGGTGSEPTVSVAFNPVATFGTDANTIRLKVTQAASESDISAIVVRVPVVPAIGAVQVTNLTQNNPAASIAGVGGEVSVGGVVKMTLGMTATGVGTLSGLTAAPFGQTLHYNTGIEKDGHLVVPALSNAVLGHVRVFTGTDQPWWQATNVYVAAKYIDDPAFNNANSLKTVHGHQTHLDFVLPDGVTFTNSTSLVIHVHVTPRAAGATPKTVTATYDATIL